jgi:hypothetical protein
MLLFNVISSSYPSLSLSDLIFALSAARFLPADFHTASTFDADGCGCDLEIDNVNQWSWWTSGDIIIQYHTLF